MDNFRIIVSLPWLYQKYRSVIDRWSFDPIDFLDNREDGEERRKRETWSREQLADLKCSEFAFEWAGAVHRFVSKGGHSFVEVVFDGDGAAGCDIRMVEMHNPSGWYEVCWQGKNLDGEECYKMFDGLKVFIDNYTPE